MAVAAGRASRVDIGRTAVEAALGTPGVIEVSAGAGERMHATAGEGERVPGVVVLAEDEERLLVGLHLVTSLEPLPALSERVRDSVLRAAAERGFDGRIGRIDVVIEDIVLDGPEAS
ncbi:MAG: hypothetical protein R3C15_17870 [Thermoleophilia bacterium]